MLRKYFLFVLAASVFVAVVTWCMITKEKPKHLSWKKSALTEYIENIPSNVDMVSVLFCRSAKSGSRSTGDRGP